MNEFYEKPFYQSQKWWTWAVGQGLSVFAASQGLIDWQWVLAPALGFSVGQGLADFGKNRRMPNALKKPAAPANDANQAYPAAQPAPTPQPPPLPSSAPPEPPASGGHWDLDAFDQLVQKKAPLKYSVLNPATELFMAMDLGQVTRAEHFDHVEAYWDYIQMKADSRFNSIWGYSYAEALENVAEPGCPSKPSTCGRFSSLKHKALSLGEQYYTAFLDYSRIQRKAGDIAELSYHVQRGLNWRAMLPTNRQTLYWTGESAAELLKYL